ncbi:MAG: hypothetical protein KC457_32970, partial [Myxococcales bacterium]|nr:hypothetical protein [Myxococcales bacterium]
MSTDEPPREGGRPPLHLGFVDEAPAELHWPDPGEGRRRVVPARVGPELTLPAGEGLDALAALVFDGPAGEARLAPLIE